MTVQVRESWIGPIGIAGVHIGVKTDHDGYVDIHVGVTLSSTGEQELNEFLQGKVTGLDSIMGTECTIKVIAAPGPNQRKLNSKELTKLGNSTKRAIKAWAADCKAEEIVSYCHSLDPRNAMAVASSTGSWHVND